MIGLAVAGIMAMICISVHFEAMVIVERICDSIRSGRRSLLMTWAGLLSAHVVEIWLYAGAYWICDLSGIGGLSGRQSALDYAYFSAVVYTTLGFGDILPEEGVQMLAGSEALVGLCLIAWSATITYGHVQSLRNR
jgi:hypothetical protein